MDHAQSPGARPRSRAFSFRSDKSGGSKPSHHKQDLSESPAEKRRRDSLWKGGSKANPNAAMTEAQPGDAARAESTTIASSRDVQFKDTEGNPISEPDLSNPTRPRWERPLDTIRSFERAIDGDYKRRSMSRTPSYDPRDHFASKRNSSYGFGGGYDSAPSPNRYSSAGGGYYAGRGQDFDSYSSYDNPAPPAPQSRYRSQQRVNGSDNGIPRSSTRNSLYPQHGYHASYDTVNTGGSDSTGPWANSTDPSSENSSIDKMNSNGKMTPQPMGDYGYDGMQPGPIAEEYDGDAIHGGYGGPMRRSPSGFDMQNGNGNGYSSGYGNGGPSAPTHSQQQPARQPIKLGGGGGGGFESQGGSLPPATRPSAAQDEKKKGWLKRRFSKKA